MAKAKPKSEKTPAKPKVASVDTEEIAQIPFLQSASSRALKKLAASTKLVEYPTGALIFQQKSLPTEVLVVKEGSVRIFFEAPDGTEDELRTLGPGRIIGELGVLAGARRTASAEAIEPTELWSFKRDAFAEIYTSEPGVAIEVARTMAPYLLDNDQVATDLLGLDLKGRVAKRLLSVAGYLKGSDAPMAALPLTTEEIAMMAGGTEADVTQILNEFERAGLIESNVGLITLAKPEVLAEYAGL